MRIDITPIVDKVLDGTEYAGLTLREWIAEIKNAQIERGKSDEHLRWKMHGEKWKCPSCDESYSTEQMGVFLWFFCPKCGVRLRTPYAEDVK